VYVGATSNATTRRTTKFFIVRANSWCPSFVPPHAGLNLQNHSVTYRWHSTINPLPAPVLMGFYSAWERWFDAAGLATEP
jgi:hypothetical protein